MFKYESSSPYTVILGLNCRIPLHPFWGEIKFSISTLLYVSCYIIVKKITTKIHLGRRESRYTLNKISVALFLVRLLAKEFAAFPRNTLTNQSEFYKIV